LETGNVHLVVHGAIEKGTLQFQLIQKCFGGGDFKFPHANFSEAVVLNGLNLEFHIEKRLEVLDC
jgi:hypothetical protein